MGYNLVGIVGPLASGKGVVTEYLIKKHGYRSFSLSTLVHEALKKRSNDVITRTSLQDMGDEMRKKGGVGILAKMAIERFTSQHQPLHNIIIEGIRNPGEITYLRTIPGFVLIAVDAPREVRFKRVISRGKPWDPKDWETFIQVDGRDRGDGRTAVGQQVRLCMELADFTVENKGERADVEKKIEDLLILPSDK